MKCHGFFKDDKAAQVTPYLMPFGVEFALVAISAFYIMWYNIGANEKHDDLVSAYYLELYVLYVVIHVSLWHMCDLYSTQVQYTI